MKAKFIRETAGSQGSPKIPQRLYGTSEMRKHFSINYNTLKHMWDKGEGEAEVESDYGDSYFASLEYNRWNDKFIKLKRVYE